MNIRIENPHDQVSLLLVRAAKLLLRIDNLVRVLLIVFCLAQQVLAPRHSHQHADTAFISPSNRWSSAIPTEIKMRN